MDVNGILQAITTVGFPIVMCAALFWYMIEQNKAHAEETNALRSAIEDLRTAVTKLIEKLGG